jgi:hypothetical protein
MSLAKLMTPMAFSGVNFRSLFSRKAHLLALLCVWVFSAAYLGMHLKRGWVPSDEGTLGQAAERVLLGQMPHRDFDDYTGGLTFLYAAAFRVLGINCFSMRIVLFSFFILWVPCVYLVASRFGPWYSASVVTLLAVVWSVPNYPGPMPSWYNLFLATFGSFCLLRFVETNFHRWMFLAGCCGGFSILVKITGIYFVTAAFLFFLFHEQNIALLQHRHSTKSRKAYPSVIALGLFLFLWLLFRMIVRPGKHGLFYFFFPAFLIAVFLIAREIKGITKPDQERFRNLWQVSAPFLLGVGLPIALFVLAYAVRGAAGVLLHGLVGTASRAVNFVFLETDHPTVIFHMIPFALPVILAYDSGRLGRLVWGSLLACFAVLVLVASAHSSLVYGFGWSSIFTCTPALTAAGLAILWKAREKNQFTTVRQEQLMVLLCVTALCGLIQFPLSAPIYFLYVAPLVILFADAILSSVTDPPKFVLGVLAIFYLLFAVIRVMPGFVWAMGVNYEPDYQTARLSMRRAGGLRVWPSEAETYNSLIPKVQAHSTGEFIYAFPDCPEVYFLSELRSPTGHFFSFAEDRLDRTEVLLDVLQKLNINVIAINSEPQFSKQIEADLHSALAEIYPHSEEVGRFEVRWKQ